MTQLSLPVALPDQARFTSYFAGPNAVLIAYLRRFAALAADPVAWIWGVPASGKTHLLQAVCREAGERGTAAAFVGLARPERLSPELLSGWEAYGLICVDDVDGIAGRSAWEHALFALFNAAMDQGRRLLFSARAAPGGTGFALRDLASRLASGPSFEVQALDDDQRLAALVQRAGTRGLDLPPESARFLLTRLPRDMRSLCDALDALDGAALRAQRRLTLPFVRDAVARLGLI